MEKTEIMNICRYCGCFSEAPLAHQSPDSGAVGICSEAVPQHAVDDYMDATLHLKVHDGVAWLYSHSTCDLWVEKDLA